MIMMAAALLLAAAHPASAQQYVISTVAGGAPPPTPAAALAASIGSSYGVAVDGAGNAYFTGLNCVFKVDQNGILTRVAGNSRAGYSGDGGSALSAQLFAPSGVAVDGLGNLFVADSVNHRVRRVSANGIITTVAGGGFGGDGGPAASAELNYPRGVAIDESGSLLIADYVDQRVRKVSPSGLIMTVAGTGTQGFSGDGGPGASAQLSSPIGVAVDGAGNIFIADSGNNRVRMVSASGIITTVAGTEDGGPATGASPYVFAVAVDGPGNVYIAE
jgi:sugar lactone lactonase YvrE